MNLVESLKMALRSLTANKLRAGLTMLGMIIGVSAVIALMAIGQGATASITGQIQGMGTNLLFVTPGASTQGGVSFGQGSSPTLTLEDSAAIFSEVPEVAGVAPQANNRMQVVYGPNNTNTSILGTTPDYQDVRNSYVASGDFFTQLNLDSRSRVALLGSTTAQALFGEADPIGQQIKINRVSFQVIGVMETKGSQAGGNQDDVVIIPITTLLQRLSRARTSRGGLVVQSINVQVVDEQSMQAAVQGIGDLLLTRHRVNQPDFTIRSQEDILSTLQGVTQTLTILLGAIAGISLIVGGIGIMNIMLVSVTERTREIGIRKAVGAKHSDIMIQFIIEAMVVSLMGGLVGVLLGFGISQLVSGIPLGGQPLRTVVSGDAVILAFGVSAAIGLFFGIYPASRAAGLDPIQALRYE
jgi:putative ABC transport system permease protein